MISMDVTDYSGQAWFQGFNDVGQVVFGISADDLVDIRVGVVHTDTTASTHITTGTG